ncbi:MAG: PhnD/SsuA/transferrin family substrate-binding protein [Salinarimonas sp.]|nr:PhnD/SsuA/transferrin family substrate-binding protein [Salinarimonas sp.]
MSTNGQVAKAAYRPRPDSSQQGIDRRAFGLGLAGLAGTALFPLPAIAARSEVRFGLTPVFLDSDIRLIADLEAYLGARLARPVTLVKRRTYMEITALLVAGQIDAAWICGLPFIRHRDALRLVAAPVYRGAPHYRSLIITRSDTGFEEVEDLRGTIHAFSDPQSNSGKLVTQAFLAEKGETVSDFFADTFYAYGHRNVIRAVASGLAQSGSVENYVWEVMRDIEPDLIARTRVLRRSEAMGFPPVAASLQADPALVDALREALLAMPEDDRGQHILKTLRLDGFARVPSDHYDQIAGTWRMVHGAG